MARVILTRLAFSTGEDVEYRVGGDYVDPEDAAPVRIVLGDTGQRTAWWDLPLPACPDCGGDLVWCEAGYVPGARRCMGKPLAPDRYDYDGGCGSMFSVDTERHHGGHAA